MTIKPVPWAELPLLQFTLSQTHVFKHRPWSRANSSLLPWRTLSIGWTPSLSSTSRKTGTPHCSCSILESWLRVWGPAHLDVDDGGVLVGARHVLQLKQGAALALDRAICTPRDARVSVGWTPHHRKSRHRTGPAVNELLVVSRSEFQAASA